VADSNKRFSASFPGLAEMRLSTITRLGPPVPSVHPGHLGHAIMRCVGEDLVRVFSTQSLVEGEIVIGRLEAEGIPVDLRGAREGPYPLGPAELFVPIEVESQARRVIAQIESGSFDVPDGDGAE
jgi:hypothetical protein